MEDILVGGTSMLKDADAETERCGICMEEVIDRGVLDCCDHWFCFMCIDNWAIITNLCPLCKAQFEIITCLPVYDTIGGSNKQNNSCAVGGTERDQNWYVYGKNNALSFPSYYIDEDAIVCLDGDGCRIRAGVTTNEEESSSFDTSVACDSCDIWYHAVCVEFNPEHTIENTWLCPRCKTSGMLKDAISTFCQISPEKDVLNPKSNNDTVLNSKVLVHVADAGETALVVSMVEGENCGQTTKGKFGEAASVEDKQDANRVSMPLCTDHSNLMQFRGVEERFGEAASVEDKQDANRVSMPLCTDHSNLMQLRGVEAIDQLPDNMVTINACKGGSTFPATNDSTSLLVDDSSRRHSMSMPDNEIDSTDTLVGSETSHSVANLEDKAKPSSLVENNEFCGLASDSHHIVESPTAKRMEEDNEVLVHFGNASSGKSIDKSHAETGVDKHVEKNDTAEESVMDGEPAEISSRRLNAEKRKLDPKCRDTFATMDSVQCGQRLGKTAKHKHNEISIKRARPSGWNEHISLPSSKGRCDANEATISKDNFGLKKKLRSNKLQNHTHNDVISPQVMSLVKGLEFPAIAKTLQHSSTRNTVSKNDHINSVRIKKIMPRRMDENKTSCLVQELRKELRIASGHDTTDDLGKIDASDDRLLAAFKAAMVRTCGNDSSDRTNRSHLKVNHRPLKRGKIRENLTRKLYGTGNGKRRGWEIEFWKERCDKTKQLKNVENPGSIRNLLKKSLDACSKSLETEQMSETDVADPIFSRLYIADTSLFPRKDDIKPLSAYLNAGNVQIGRSDAELVKVERTCNGTNNKCEIPISKVDTAAGSVHPTKQCAEIKKFNSILDSATLQTTVVQQKTGNSSDVKLDKRKWALEVLARKTGSNERKTESSLGKTGSFPLLIQLPSDMRPILPHNRHSHVPTAVRQMQLNRLVEHYLKKADLETIRRSAESEFAVADAVNKENEIYERSNCKSVYINLCAQALSQEVSNHSVVVKDGNFHGLGTELGDAITEALRAAGLISDSPPGSPYHITENNVVETDNVGENKDNVIGCIDNILDLDCHPALDIYRDFEYELEDLEIPGPSNASKISNSSLIPDNAASKVKVILSTVQQSKHSADQLLDGEKDNESCLEQADNGAPLVTRAEFIPDTKESTFPSVDDIQVRSGIERSATPDTQIDKINNLGSSSRAVEDIESYMPKVDPGEVGQSDLGLTLGDHSANLIGSQDQSSCDNHNSYQVKRQTSFVSCPLKQEVGAFLLVNDQVSDGGLESGSANLLFKGSMDDTKRVNPQGDSAISKEDKHDSDSEIEEKVFLPAHPGGNASKKDSEVGSKKKQPATRHLVWKKVEAYIKEHIRPLCKSGVVTVEQYRWAVGKTVEKVMKYHHSAKSADFLILEGNKVKKLSEQYLQAFKQKENH